MHSNTISLTAASTLEHLQALEAVSEFQRTDFGRGGPDHWTYRVLSEPFLSSELERLSNARSSGQADIVSFQPCLSYEFRNQDRHSVEEWAMADGTWRFAAVFDGHSYYNSNHDTVDHVLRHLPSMIKASLHILLNDEPGFIIPPNSVSKALSDAVVRLDNSIYTNFVGSFPGDPGCRLEDVTDQQIWATIGAEGNGRNAMIACLQGTTVLISLIDPSGRNLWVVNLGDSQAGKSVSRYIFGITDYITPVLAIRSPSGIWSGTAINSLHNGDNPLERGRIMDEHPSEGRCLQDHRVVGFLAPTRAIGDTWLKLPAEYTVRGFAKFCHDWMDPQRAREYAERLLTPPYVSNIPDVYHQTLPYSASGERTESFLILCTDGLLDMYEDFGPREAICRWVEVIGQALDSPGSRSGQRPNVALCLLRDAIGGEDVQLVSRNLTVEMEERWIDDITVVVQRL